MDKLDIKPGQTWIRRDGGKARIYATDGAGDFQIHGACEIEGGWEVNSWRLDGAYFKKGVENNFDLIRLYDWREELAPIWAVLDPRFSCFAMDEDRRWFLYENEPIRCDKRYMLSRGFFERIDNLFAMPTPDCPWYETLTMRPEA